jgi:hypothetical protein
MTAMYGGAVYNNELCRLAGSTEAQLQNVIEKWDQKTFAQKAAAYLNPFGYSPELRLKAAKNMLESMREPDGEVAKQTQWKVDSYVKDKEEKARMHPFMRALCRFMLV